MQLKRLIATAILGVALSMSVAVAKTPKDTLVVADAIDDVITLDPHEVSEIGGVLTTNQVYQPLVSFDPKDPSQIIGVLAKSNIVFIGQRSFVPESQFVVGQKNKVFSVL